MLEALISLHLEAQIYKIRSLNLTPRPRLTGRSAQSIKQVGEFLHASSETKRERAIRRSPTSF